MVGQENTTATRGGVEEAVLPQRAEDDTSLMETVLDFIGTRSHRVFGAEIILTACQDQDLVYHINALDFIHFADDIEWSHKAADLSFTLYGEDWIMTAVPDNEEYEMMYHVIDHVNPVLQDLRPTHRYNADGTLYDWDVGRSTMFEPISALSEALRGATVQDALAQVRQACFYEEYGIALSCLMDPKLDSEQTRLMWLALLQQREPLALHISELARRLGWRAPFSDEHDEGDVL